MKTLQLLKKKNYKQFLVSETKRYSPVDGLSYFFEATWGIVNSVNRGDSSGVSRIIATHTFDEPGAPPIQIATNSIRRVPAAELSVENASKLQKSVNSELNRRAFVFDRGGIGSQIIDHPHEENNGDNIVVVQPEPGRDYRIFVVVENVNESRAEFLNRGQIPVLLNYLLEEDPTDPHFEEPLPRLAGQTLSNIYRIMSPHSLPIMSRAESLANFRNIDFPTLNRVFLPNNTIPPIVLENMSRLIRTDINMPPNGFFYETSQIFDGLTELSRGLNHIFLQEEYHPRNHARFQNFDQLSVREQFDVWIDIAGSNVNSSLSRMLQYLSGSLHRVATDFAFPGTSQSREVVRLLAESRRELVGAFATFLGTPDARFYFTDAQRAVLLFMGGFVQEQDTPGLIITRLEGPGNAMIMHEYVYNQMIFSANSFADTIGNPRPEFYDAVRLQHARSMDFYERLIMPMVYRFVGSLSLPENTRPNFGLLPEAGLTTRPIQAPTADQYESTLGRYSVNFITAWRNVRANYPYFAYRSLPALHTGTHLYGLVLRILFFRDSPSARETAEVLSPSATDLSQYYVENFSKDVTEDSAAAENDVSAVTDGNIVVADNIKVLEENAVIEQNATVMDPDTAISTLTFLSDYLGPTAFGSILVGVISVFFLF